MGRGLSELQRVILTTALKRPGISTSDFDGRAYGINSVPGQELGADIRHEHIHKAFYGEQERTNAARVAISRAMVRLADRGLIVLMEAKCNNWAGGNLTEEGKNVAKELSVNKVCAKE